MTDDDQAWINAYADPDWSFSPQAIFPQTGALGFAALSAIIGLFSERVLLKLKPLAEIIFFKLERGADSKAPTSVDKPNQDAL